MPTLQLAPTATATKGQALLISVDASYKVPPPFTGLTYIVSPREDESDEPENRLAILVKLAREAEGVLPYCPDSADQIEAQTAIVDAMYDPQLQALAAREERQQ
jgi:hypothetical protein